MSIALSVVIRTLNSGNSLPAVLEKLHLHPGDELIIVDSGSTDDTRSLADKFGATWLELPPPFQYGRALNAGFRVARSPWVLCLSSHCFPFANTFLDDWRDALAAIPQDVVAAFGPRYLGEQVKRFPGGIRFSDRRALETGVPIHAGSSNGAYRRTTWEQLPFSELVRTGEDLEWAIRALQIDRRIAFVPQAAVLYRNPGSLRYMFLKGWHESQCDGFKRQPMTRALPNLAINLASLAWKFGRGIIPWGTWLRHSAHGIGAFAGSIHTRPIVTNITAQPGTSKT